MKHLVQPIDGFRRVPFFGESMDSLFLHRQTGANSPGLTVHACDLDTPNTDVASKPRSFHHPFNGMHAHRPSRDEKYCSVVVAQDISRYGVAGRLEEWIDSSSVFGGRTKDSIAERSRIELRYCCGRWLRSCGGGGTTGSRKGGGQAPAGGLSMLLFVRQVRVLLSSS